MLPEERIIERGVVEYRHLTIGFYVESRHGPLLICSTAEETSLAGEEKGISSPAAT